MKKKVGRPKLTVAQKRKNAASRKTIMAKSQSTKKTPSKRLQKRRKANKATGYFPNPSRARLYTCGIIFNGKTEYYFTGKGFDTLPRKAAIFATSIDAMSALECITSTQRQDIDTAEKFIKTFSHNDIYGSKKK